MATTSQTTTSSAMGSVHYASPEQARGGYVDHRSDIYSLGIVMYEMVTGRVPFDGETAVTVAVKHLQEQMVPPASIARRFRTVWSRSSRNARRKVRTADIRISGI